MKYSIKRFTKVLITKTKDEKGKWRGATSKNVEDLTDSQLYNLSRYDKDVNQQRRALKKYKKVGRLSTIAGALGGAAVGKPIIGASIGAGIGYGYGTIAHASMTKASRAADKELKRRYPFPMHIDGKDKNGAFIQPMVGKDKKGKPVWGDKIYLKK